VRFGSIPSTPEIDAYLDRILARPAFHRASELDNAAVAEFGPAG
jgi:glutathione S-transferase